MDELLTITDAARRLDKKNNVKLLNFLIRRDKIPIRKVGNAWVMTLAGFRDLETAVREWDARPLVTKPAPTPRRRQSAPA